MLARWEAKCSAIFVRRKRMGNGFHEPGEYLIGTRVVQSHLDGVDKWKKTPAVKSRLFPNTKIENGSTLRSGNEVDSFSYLSTSIIQNEPAQCAHYQQIVNRKSKIINGNRLS